MRLKRLEGNYKLESQSYNAENSWCKEPAGRQFFAAKLPAYSNINGNRLSDGTFALHSTLLLLLVMLLLLLLPLQPPLSE